MNNGRDWHAIEKLYVLGEVTGTRDDGTQIRRYPSLRDLATQFGIARSVLGNRARRGEWKATRARFQEAQRETMGRHLMTRELTGAPTSVRTAAP
jgi:hypothetical protein